MNITFLIGNGFDISCNLHSRYSEIYKEYVETPSATEKLKRFKKQLETWGDFEIEMAQYASSFNSAEEFTTCLRDFRAFLTKYLLKENCNFTKKLYDNPQIFFQETARSITEFHKGLSPNIAKSIDSLLLDTSIKYNCINYNYTTTFDQLISQTIEYGYVTGLNVSLGEIVHIHGNLPSNGSHDHDVTLGVDNENQLGKLSFKITDSMKLAFIKPYFNLQNDVERHEKAKRIIGNSNIICAYGMSFGQSDLTWKNELVAWVEKDSLNHFIFYDYNYSSKDVYERDEKITQELRAKQEFEERMNLSQDILDQIHIPVGYNIFNFYEGLKPIVADIRLRPQSHLSIPFA